MKVALVHDYLNEAGGAERVLKVLTEMYPEARIYTAFVKDGTAIKMIDPRRERIVESKWGWILKQGKVFSYLRFCLPWIWRSVDLREYDLIITSCSGYIARGFRVRDGAKVVAYCHTPPRWLYGYDTPTGAQKKWWGSAFMWVVGPFMRYFDYISAQRVDIWIANSREVASRIEKFYRKSSTVIYPPIDISYTPNNAKRINGLTDSRESQYYLMISRIVGGKGIEEAASAFKQLGIKLKIVGEVVDTRLGAKVESMGRVRDEELGELYSRANGFVAFSRDEDFGMTVVEAMLHGTPVLAYNGGGYRESVVDGKTGVLIDDTDVESVRKGIEKMERTKWDREGIKKRASKFGRARFEREMRGAIHA